MVSEATVRRLIEKWRQRLVPEWQVEVIFGMAPDREGEEEELNASIGCVADYQRSVLYFNPVAQARPRREVEITVIHELLHLVLHELDELDDRVARQLSAHTMMYHGEARRRELEQVIDRLACVLVGPSR